MHSPLFLVGKLIRRQTSFSSPAFPTHTTATAMHFPANTGLIFLTDELTNDRYLVDTGATLSIVPCNRNSSLSGPLIRGADGQPIPSWGFIKKTVQSLVSCIGRQRPADGLRQQHVRTIRLLVWDTLEDFTAILTYTWNKTKDDSTCCTYVRGRISTE